MRTLKVTPEHICQQTEVFGNKLDLIASAIAKAEAAAAAAVTGVLAPISFCFWVFFLLTLACFFYHFQFPYSRSSVTEHSAKQVCQIKPPPPPPPH